MQGYIEMTGSQATEQNLTVTGSTKSSIMYQSLQ